MGDTRSVPDEVRAKGRAIAQRLTDDAAFRQRVTADPETALREAGLPEEAFVDFMREAGIEADVIGYRECAYTGCSTFTCFITHW